MGPAHGQEAPTCDAAEEAECGSIPGILVDHALGGSLRHRDGQGDGFVELAPPRLHRDYGAHGHAVTQQLGHQLRLDGLSLQKGTNPALTACPLSLSAACSNDLDPVSCWGSWGIFKYETKFR